MMKQSHGKIKRILGTEDDLKKNCVCWKLPKKYLCTERIWPNKFCADQTLQSGLCLWGGLTGALHPKPPNKYFVHLGMFNTIKLKIESTKWTLSAGNSLYDILSLFVVLSFMSAEYLWQWQITFCLLQEYLLFTVKINQDLILKGTDSVQSTY